MRRPSTGSRLAAYTDAVFAVIITIMVLELRPPEAPTLAALLMLWPTFVSYVVSYLFIAIIWINHHYLMGYVDAITLRLVWINFAHLFCVSLLPFATAWIARTELAAIPVILYAALFVVTDGLYNVFEREILRASSEVSREVYRHARRRSLIALGLFAVAAALALIQPLLGFGFICVALLLHLTPDAAPWNRRRPTATGRDGGPAA